MDRPCAEQTNFPRSIVVDKELIRYVRYFVTEKGARANVSNDEEGWPL